MGAGLPANFQFYKGQYRFSPAPGRRPRVLRLTRIAPRSPRIAKSLGLFAHSARVFHAADRTDGDPEPDLVPTSGYIFSA